MTAPPLVSLVTPSWNQGRFIEETIQSVRRQEYPRIEHVVVDGGSTDSTLDVLRRHPHLTWVSEPDAGQSDAINKGFAKASGDIVAWLNADDTYRPGAVGAAVEFFRANPDVDLVYGDCEEVDEEGRPLRLFRTKPFDLGGLLLLEYDIPQPAVFFRRRVLRLAGVLDTRMELAMDFDYWVRIALVGRIAYTPHCWATYRVHPAAKTSTRVREVLPDHLRSLDAAFADPRLPPDVAATRRLAYSNAYLAGGVRSYEAGALAEARSRLWASLAAYPNPFRAKALKAMLLLADATCGLRVGSRAIDWLRASRRQV